MMGQRDGRDFANLLAEMERTIAEYGDVEGIRDLCRDVQKRVNLLGEMGRFVADCFRNGKALTPIANGEPIIGVLGDVCIAWVLLWQAGIAEKSLDAILRGNGIGPGDAAKRGAFLGQNKEAAFYDGKLQSARYFIKNVLPQADGLATAIMNEDLSIMAVHDDGF